MSEPLPPQPPSPDPPPVVLSSQDAWQCPNCFQVMPAEKYGKHPKGWCLFCVASASAEKRELFLKRKAGELAEKLMSDHEVSGHVMGTIEEFFGELDVSLGGVRMIAKRMSDVIDGLIDKGALTSAGQLLLQLQKLRFLIQKQHVHEDFTQLDLDQKRDRLKLEVLQFVSEQNPDDDRKEFLELVLNEHGATNSTLKDE